MGSKHFLLVCATLYSFYFSAASAQGSPVKPPLTKFSCQGRPSGYYADVDTGCQVYHMCDGVGRQFSYTCPNMTLFQQRMLICDHWYMVNCSKSEQDYDANLLIGQRDKPFVSEDEMQLVRTPRPDILTIPLNSNFYEGLKEAESKFQIHPGNSIVGVADSISKDNSLDSGKTNYRPPTSWSTGTAVNNNARPSSNKNGKKNEDIHSDAAVIKPSLSHHNNANHNNDNSVSHAPTPSRELVPPATPKDDAYDIDVRMKTEDDSVINFINRFDPDSPDSYRTSMSKTEIIDLNSHLPLGQSSAEDDRASKNNKNFGSNFNNLEDRKDKNSIEPSRFDTINTKTSSGNIADSDVNANGVPVPERILLPPKTDYSIHPVTTMGPPVYYEWKWAAPAFDLVPPAGNAGNDTNSTHDQPRARSVTGNPFSDVTRTPPPLAEDQTPRPINVDYNISSYVVPDFVFPLDDAHPGYKEENARTSFQVKVPETGKNYGENPECPQCHPAYVIPGTCQPCVINR